MTPAAETAAAHRAVEAVWRIESARIIAGLAGLVRDVGLAEELAQDALVAALEQWPADGIPPNPGALAEWSPRSTERSIGSAGTSGSAATARLLGPGLEAEQQGLPKVRCRPQRDEEYRRRLLRLMFISCHPLLSTEPGSRSPLRPARRPDRRRSPVGSSRRSRPSPSGSCGPRTRWPTSRSRSEVPSRRPSARPGWRGAPRCLPGVQRGLLGHGRGRLDAARLVQRGAAPRPRAS